jgi:ankyrin repeat protein
MDAGTDSGLDVAGIRTMSRKARGQRPEPTVRHLIAALSASIEEGAKMLREHPELLHAKTGRGETALHWLAVENQVDAVKFLLSRGAAADEPANSGDTPLMSAATLGLEEVCAALIRAGANVNADDENGDTALHHAAQTGKVAVIAMLVAAGANPRAENKFNQTPGDRALPRLREKVLAALEG